MQPEQISVSALIHKMRELFEAYRRLHARTPDTLLRERDLQAYDTLGHSRRWDYIAAGSYPKPIRLSEGGRHKAWYASEICAWQHHRAAVRDGTAKPGSSWRDYLPEPGQTQAPVADASVVADKQAKVKSRA
jgi:predicted DNA-binding transcriptional regulator AlpA